MAQVTSKIGQPPGRLAHARVLAHRMFARVAFVGETCLLAAGFFQLLTFAILGGDRVLIAHEWSLFLSHYAVAAKAARTPVDAFLAATLLVLIVGVGACRLSSARLVWRARDRGRPSL